MPCIASVAIHIVNMVRAILAIAIASIGPEEIREELRCYVELRRQCPCFLEGDANST